MAFLGGLVSGAAKGVASRHEEKRKFDQEQKIQDTRIRDEAAAKAKQSQLEMQIDLIMKGSGPWSQKQTQIRSALQTAGAMKPADIDSFVQSMAPVGALHDATQAQGLPTMPPVPKTGGGGAGGAGGLDDTGAPIDPHEFGKHLGYSMGEHQVNGGDPEELNLAPHIGTLAGLAARGQSPPSGGAQDSGSPSQDPQTPGPQVSQPSSGNNPTPTSPLPSQDAQYEAPLVRYQREVAENAAQAGSSRDVAKIRAQNAERLKLEQGRIDLIQKMQGSSGRPSHSYITEGTNGPVQHFDAGRNSGMVSGADIEEELEHGGEGAAKIDHSPETLYLRREFPMAGGLEYHKVNNFKGYGPVHEDPQSPGTFVKDALSKTGGIVGSVRVPTPYAQTERTHEVGFIDPATGQRSIQTLHSGPTQGPLGPPSPPGNTPRPQGGPFTPMPQPPSPSAAIPPGISAMADMWQNDPTTARMLTQNYPRNSPQKIAIQKEVERRLAAGEGPVPVFLGANTRNQVQQAKLMAPEIESTAKDISRLSDKLGPIMGRWNEFLAGTVGSGDTDFQKLRSDLSLIKSKVSQIHFGSQSGVQAVERFDKIMNAGRMDAQTLQAGLTSLAQILKLYGSLNVTSGAALQEGGANSRATPGSPLPAPTQGGKIRARDPQGKLHEAPAGTSLPAGWKLEN